MSHDIRIINGGHQRTSFFAVACLLLLAPSGQAALEYSRVASGPDRRGHRAVGTARVKKQKSATTFSRGAQSGDSTASGAVFIWFPSSSSAGYRGWLKFPSLGQPSRCGCRRHRNVGGRLARARDSQPANTKKTTAEGRGACTSHSDKFGGVHTNDAPPLSPRTRWVLSRSTNFMRGQNRCQGEQRPHTYPL